MLKNAKGISKDMLLKFNKNFKSDNLNVVLQNAASKVELTDILYVPASKVGNAHQFSIDIKTLPATSQKASGRCWIFAATNVLREIVAKKCNLDNFELSQNYIAFYDKLEKVNWALESVIDLKDKETDDRVLQTIVRFPVGDGGQWDMFKSLVKKYGVCPKNVMDETFSSSNTRSSGFILNTLVRQFAAELRHTNPKDPQPLKEAYLEKAFKVLSVVFGTPVEEFDFEYVDKNKNYHIDKNLTPKTFYDKYVGEDIDEYVSLVNATTSDKPFNQTFTVDYIGNVVDGDPIKYLNLEMSELKAAVIRQMKAGEIVWFGSDCGKYGDRQNGNWDPLQYAYDKAFGFSTYMDKADMLDYGQSAMNHAMCLTGVNLDGERPTKWKIENSWGQDIAHKGYFTATDLWFDNFVYQAVVKKKYLTKEQLKNLEKEPKHLTPWDPMGTLAD